MARRCGDSLASGNLNDAKLSPSSTESCDSWRRRFSRPCTRKGDDWSAGRTGRGRYGSAVGMIGVAVGNLNVKLPGLNSGAATLSGLPMDGIREWVEGFSEVGVMFVKEPEAPRGAPKTKGFALGLRRGTGNLGGSENPKLTSEEWREWAWAGSWAECCPDGKRE